MKQCMKQCPQVEPSSVVSGANPWDSAVCGGVVLVILFKSLKQQAQD